MPNSIDKLLNDNVTRRDMFKLGGASLLAVGLAYSQPFIETVSAKAAFGKYGGDDNDDDDHTEGGNCDKNHPGWDCSSIYISDHQCDGTVLKVTVCNSPGSSPLSVSVPWMAQIEDPSADFGVREVNGSLGPLTSSSCETVEIETDGHKVLLFKTYQHPNHPGGSSDNGLKLQNISCGESSSEEEGDEDKKKKKKKK